MLDNTPTSSITPKAPHKTLRSTLPWIWLAAGIAVSGFIGAFIALTNELGIFYDDGLIAPNVSTLVGLLHPFFLIIAILALITGLRTLRRADIHARLVLGTAWLTIVFTLPIMMLIFGGLINTSHTTAETLPVRVYQIGIYVDPDSTYTSSVTYMTTSAGFPFSFTEISRCVSGSCQESLIGPRTKIIPMGWFADYIIWFAVMWAICYGIARLITSRRSQPNLKSQI